MENYPIDLEPRQIVRWIIAESQIAPHEFKATARREVETRALPTRKELRLGDEERDDLSETATIATLEIAPAQATEGWRLKITVEDELGPQPLGRSAAGQEREMDVAAFYDSFLRQDRGLAVAAADVEGPEGEAHLARLLEDIETNRHGASRAGKPA